VSLSRLWAELSIWSGFGLAVVGAAIILGFLVSIR
jgi:hypothetical protein